MTNICTLHVLDQVNVKITGLDPVTKRRLVQAAEYFIPQAKYMMSYKLGKWNGKINFCDLAGRTYVNYLHKLIPHIVQAGYEIEVNDARPDIKFTFDEISTTSYSHVKWPAGHPNENESIVLRSQQVTAINKFLSNTQGICVLPTAVGKTIVTAILSHQIEKYGRSIIIVPSKDLVLQTEHDYKLFGLDVGVFYGDRKELNKTHTICTWQGLSSLIRNKDKHGETVLRDIFENRICVITDEAHTAQSAELKRILVDETAHVPIRWGLTGTFPREEHNQCALTCYIGENLMEITTSELQDEGSLARCNVNIWQYVDKRKFGNYRSESSELAKDLDRLSHLAERIVTEVLPTGNTLILVSNIATGDLLESMIPNSVFINGSVLTKKRKEQYERVKTEDNITIIATFGVASVGINMNRLFNLVLFEAGKSFTRVIQSIGRGLRVAADKDHVEIYDICSTTKYSKLHSATRIKYYKEKQFPYTVTKIDRE